MPTLTHKHLDSLWSDDRAVQNRAFSALMAATETPVDWAYDVWDELLTSLRHRDNHRRAIAAQLLCNLTKSDPDGRLLHDFPALLAVTRDERFVTAWHCLQSLWKIGVVGQEQRRMVVDGLVERYRACGAEKNGTLLRYDIVQGLRNLYDAVQDASVKETALGLIETETDQKYRKKYAAVWRRL